MDELFLKFVRGLLIIMALYGLGMMLILLIGDQVIGLRMVNAFTSMFVGVLGLGSGYLLGRRIEQQRNGNDERRPHDSSTMGSSGRTSFRNGD